MTQYSREDQTTKVTTEDGQIPQNNNFNISDDTHESLNYINKYRNFIVVISSLYNSDCVRILAINF